MAIIMTTAAIPIVESPSPVFAISGVSTKIVVSYVMTLSFRNESLYFTSIVISCSPLLASPIGKLNGTGLSGSISSMYCVDS